MKRLPRKLAMAMAFSGVAIGALLAAHVLFAGQAKSMARKVAGE